MYHNSYFFCTLLNSNKNSARAKVAGSGKSPEGEGEGGFLGQTIWMGRLVDIANVQIIAFASIFSLFPLLY